MQERRSIVRTPYPCRIQYCSSEDFLPRDGQLINVSERGAGLLIRETYREGERLTLNVPLPGEDEGVTATGVVRWAGAKPSKGRWYAAGVEWLPLEDEMRQRLRSFVQQRAKPVPSQARRASPPLQPRVRSALLLGLMLIPLLVIGGLVASKFSSLFNENRQLHEAVTQRNTMISRLKQRESRLQEELGEAKVQLASSVAEVDRLDAHTQRLANDVQRLTQDVAQVQASAQQLQDEREALMQRVLDLEQERVLLSRQLTSLPHLRLAIREAVNARKLTQRDEWRRRIESQREAARRPSESGNRGYIIWAGKPTLQRTTWIRVLEPQAAPPLTPAKD